MDRTCSTHRGDEKRISGFGVSSRKLRHQQVDLDVGERTILKWILEKQNRVAWTGLIWLGIGMSGGLL
jgi:hypothetical protein